MAEHLERRSRTIRAEVLSGWKDIANYLGRGVRTVQRYERELRLPVRRLAGKPRGSVLAMRRDLDDWALSSALPKPMQLTPQALALLEQIDQLKRLCAEARRLTDEYRLSRENLHRSVQMAFPRANGTERSAPSV